MKRKTKEAKAEITKSDPSKMTVRLNQDYNGFGKKNDVIEVSDLQGSRLVCEGAASVESYPQASPENVGMTVLSEAQLEKIENEHDVERKES